MADVAGREVEARMNLARVFQWPFTMNTQHHDPEQFVDHNTLASLLGTSRAVLNRATTTAYECLQNGQLHEAEVIGRGLVAADHRSWYYRTLLAFTLQRRGRIADAINHVDQGLKYSPGHPDLLTLRSVLVQLPNASSAAPRVAKIQDDLLPRSMRA
jgi:hypothetical protein